MAVPDEIGELLIKAEEFEARAISGDQELYQAAAKEYEKAAELSEGYYGNLREETLNIRDRWAVSLRNAGDLSKAIACDLKNVDRTLENHNQCMSRQEDNDTVSLYAGQRHLDAQRRLAESYLESKQYAEAIRMFKALVDTGMPRSAELICEARVDLASALFESGADRNIMEAVNLNMVTLQKAETDLGNDHIETIKVRYNLGAELYALKKYDDALMKFGELLEILQMDYCRARSSPDYEGYLNDAERYLLRCSVKIARKEDKARFQAVLKAEEEARMEELENQLAEQQIVEQQVREAMAREEEIVRQQSLVEAEERRRKEELERNLADLIEVQETRRRQRRRQRRLEAEVAAKEKAKKEERKKAGLDRSDPSSAVLANLEYNVAIDASATSTAPPSRVSTGFSIFDMPEPLTRRVGTDQARRDQANRARARKDVATAICNVIGKCTNDGVLAKGPVAKNMHEQHVSPSIASPGVGVDDSPASLGICSQPEGMTYANRENKLDIVGTTTITGTSGTPTHSGTVSNITHRPGLTEANLFQLQQMEAPRTDAIEDQDNEEPDIPASATKSIGSEATVGAAITPGNLTEKPYVKNEALEEQKQRLADNSSISEAGRLVLVAEPNSESKVDVVDQAIEIPEAWRELHRKCISELLAAVSRLNTQQKNRPRSVSGSAPRMTAIESSSRRHSAPFIKLPKFGASVQRVGHPENAHGQPIAISEAHDDAENETPRSPQSDYRTASPSSPARRRSPTEDVRGSSRHAEIEELHGPLVSLNGSGTAKLVDDVEAGPDWLQDYMVSASDEASNPAQHSFETSLLSLTSSKDTWPTSSPIGASSLRNTETEVSGTDNTESEAETLVDKQSQPVTHSIPFSVIRTDTLKSDSSERIVPGGWHQDFDEPGPVPMLRRSRSNDQQGAGGLRISQMEDTSHRRASSVDLSRASMLETPNSPIKNWSHQDEIIADEWFEHLRSHAHALLDKYKDDSFKAKKSERPVKIAVLDTGVAKSSANGPVPLLMKGPRVKFGKQLDLSLQWNIDTKGHGTHAAGLILTVCPYADVYVYRVCEGNEATSGINRKHVAEAIADAVDKKKVDIISMSLGWEENSHRELQAAIRHARDSNVLLFAASSNEGIRTKAGMAYPARALEVIAVDAADGHGNPSKFNPPQTRDKARFSALGEAVRSTYPMHLPSEDPEPGWKRMVGTSCATPIAAGIAGLVLEFARQRPLCFDPSIEAHLKSVEGMRLILTKCLSLKYAESSPFNHLDPTILFHCNKRSEDGGGWSEYLSPRFKAAFNIVTNLREEFSSDIGSQMASELERELATSPKVRDEGGRRSWFR